MLSSMIVALRKVMRCKYMFLNLSLREKLRYLITISAILFFLSSACISDFHTSASSKVPISKSIAYHGGVSLLGATSKPPRFLSVRKEAFVSLRRNPFTDTNKLSKRSGPDTYQSALSSAAAPVIIPSAVSITAESGNCDQPQTPGVSQSAAAQVSSHPIATPTTGSHRGDLSRARDNVSQPVAQMLYEDMLTGRTIEDMCAQMYYRGKVSGFVHLYNGQEAISTGVLKALRPDDYCVSTYRDHVHAVSKGVPLREVFAELYGKETGCSKGRGGSMHMFSKKYGMIGGFAYIGEQVPVALGFAFSSSYRKYTKEINDSNSDQVTVCFTGDGSTNMGQFYEAMNIASIAKLPVIFVVENNNWAIGMAHYRSTSVPEIYKKAEGFGIPGVEVDGMDVLAVRKVAREAIERARRGDGPTLIEALTYRFRGHSLADPDELRAPLEKQSWLERDPINSFAEYMKHMGYATPESLKQTEKRVREIVHDAVKFADSSAEPVVEDIGKYIFGVHYVPTPEKLSTSQLQGYAKALRAELEYKERRKNGDKSPPALVQLERNPLTVID